MPEDFGSNFLSGLRFSQERAKFAAQQQQTERENFIKLLSTAAKTPEAFNAIRGDIEGVKDPIMRSIFNAMSKNVEVQQRDVAANRARAQGGGGSTTGAPAPTPKPPKPTTVEPVDTQPQGAANILQQQGGGQDLVERQQFADDKFQQAFPQVGGQNRGTLPQQPPPVVPGPDQSFELQQPVRDIPIEQVTESLRTQTPQKLREANAGELPFDDNTFRTSLQGALGRRPDVSETVATDFSGSQATIKTPGTVNPRQEKLIFNKQFNQFTGTSLNQNPGAYVSAFEEFGTSLSPNAQAAIQSDIARRFGRDVNSRFLERRRELIRVGKKPDNRTLLRDVIADVSAEQYGGRILDPEMEKIIFEKGTTTKFGKIDLFDPKTSKTGRFLFNETAGAVGRQLGFAPPRKLTIDASDFLTRASKTELQKQTVEGISTFREVKNVTNLFEDQFLEFGIGTKVGLAEVVDKLGLAPEFARNFLTRYNNWSARQEAIFTNLRTSATGAAFSEKELDELDQIAARARTAKSPTSYRAIMQTYKERMIEGINRLAALQMAGTPAGRKKMLDLLHDPDIAADAPIRQVFTEQDINSISPEELQSLSKGDAAPLSPEAVDAILDSFGIGVQ
jgi:hypothetical protein